MKIRLRRQIGFHVVQTYIPSIIFVSLSWLTLFVSPESIPGMKCFMQIQKPTIKKKYSLIQEIISIEKYFSGRIGMGMTTLLTLTAMFGATRQNVPRVSYVSYLDIWMVTCIIFVFGTMIEFTIVHSLYRSNRRPMGEYLESVMKLVIPSLFFGFNVIYWATIATS